MTQTSKRSSLSAWAAFLLSVLLGIGVGLLVGWSFREREASIMFRPSRRLILRTLSGPGAHLGAPSAGTSVAMNARQPSELHGSAEALSIRVAAREKMRMAAQTEVVTDVMLIDNFPAFVRTVQPVSQVPNWGAMRTPAEWNRSYVQMQPEDFVPVPVYDLSRLMIPLSSLIKPIRPESIPTITAKLYYSTRHFGQYDLDSGEFSGNHPGVDLKLAPGTPIGSIAGGRVHAVKDASRLGTYVIIEHRHPTDGVFFSVYGHLDQAIVREGQNVVPGQTIGTIGMTGNTSGPHVHLQVDRDTGNRPHDPYAPVSVPSRDEAEKYAVSPMEFISRYADGVGG